MDIDRNSLVRVFDKMSEGILVLGDDWKILYANANGRRFLGLSATEERISEDLRPKLKRDFILSADISDIETADEHSIDFEAMNPEDRSFDMTLSLYMSRPTEEGTRIVLIRDITHEQQERELKQDFLSFISHKLRTPISSLKMGVDNLYDGIFGDVSDKQRKALDMSRKKIAILDGTLDKLITFVSLRSERLRAEAYRIDVETVAQNFCKSFARKCRTKPITLKFEMDAGDSSVEIRESLFNTMMECILDNSVKFSNNPQVAITVSCRRLKPDNELVVKVSDDGPGMPPSIQQNAFNPFTQRDDDFTGNVAGLGLGLATVNYLMKLYGGRAELESTSGKGTSVKLVFPPVGE